MANWKRLERQASRLLGGQRVYRGGDFSQKAPDVIHPAFAIECKHSKNFPKWIKEIFRKAMQYDTSKGKIPLGILQCKSQKHQVVLIRLKDFAEIWKLE